MTEDRKVVAFGEAGTPYILAQKIVDQIEILYRDHPEYAARAEELLCQKLNTRQKEKPPVNEEAPSNVERMGTKIYGYVPPEVILNDHIGVIPHDLLLIGFDGHADIIVTGSSGNPGDYILWMEMAKLQVIATMENTPVPEPGPQEGK